MNAALSPLEASILTFLAANAYKSEEDRKWMLQMLKHETDYNELSLKVRELAEDITKEGSAVLQKHPDLKDLFDWAASNQRLVNQQSPNPPTEYIEVSGPDS